MGRKLSIGVVGLFVIGALVIGMTGTVLAQEENPKPESKPFAWHGRGHGFGRVMGGQVGLEAIAESLGMTPDELTTQLWGGKTLADLAEEAGIPLEDLQETIKAALEQAQRDGIEQAVKDGYLTREHADWLLEGLEKGYMGGPRFNGFGGHPGCGGFRGRGGFPRGDNESGIFNRFRRATSDA